MPKFIILLENDGFSYLRSFSGPAVRTIPTSRGTRFAQGGEAPSCETTATSEKVIGRDHSSEKGNDNCLHYYVDEFNNFRLSGLSYKYQQPRCLKLGSVCLINRRIFRCQRTLEEITSKFTSLIEVLLPHLYPFRLFLSPPPPIRYEVTKKSLVHPKQVKNTMEREISIREPDAAEKHVHSNLCITDDENSSEETDLLGTST